MSLLDTASLICTPNGYKEGKLYSVIPSDGSGDLSVTRATTATRVNSQGLVELVPYNLFNYSEELNNSAWDWVNEVTITANAATAPNGTTTADRLQGTGAFWYFGQGKNLRPNVSHTISAYVKSNTGSSQTFRLFSCNSLTSSNLTATTEWQRFEFTFTSTTDIIHGISRNSSNATADLLVWGAQIVEGSVAKDYQKTETRLNIPRLDYSNGTCPSILVEPQRTNLLTYSSSFDNADWTAQTTIVSANATTAPDGTTTADTLTPSGSSAYDNRVYQTHTVTNGAVYTLSVWAKSSASNAKLTLGLQNHGGQVFSITDQWKRYSVAVTALNTGGNFNIYAGDVTPTTGVVNSSNVVTIWGAQLEAGSYATSYIPTTSASVTRNADVISKTGISSLIGQTEGTLFWDVDFQVVANNDAIFIKDNASYDTFVFMQKESSGIIACGYYGSGALQARIESSAVPTGRYKIAFAYKNNDFVMYLNGTQVGTDTSGTVSGLMDYFDLHWTESGCNNAYAAALWKTRLTNTQLAQLTTL